MDYFLDKREIRNQKLETRDERLETSNLRVT